ncbi:pyridoxamine phosphate oxidase [Gaeumannomyces tritici R3-111a-1]|uniref:Pyridoxamine phosphate oxidase n=1 Tax=Gaeumannomyces tritici (strain R3-111a-1) TaxID=644352 RepID=J3NT00_GAET3|nr:pyridoxamine phosphate oxidase [Gaeumannomyces tritici R3-111a-1]EJT79313.1 pyridoxamine phosphate oxidase [Gaeumannomyces tritici R3-111a-1]
MKVFPALTPDLTAWALRQPVYFVATAPTHGRHVNLSPKGLPSTTLAVLGPNRIAYVDRTGSGCETIAHLYENGRATVMFMSMGPSPRILRLYCRAREVVEWGVDEARFVELLAGMGRGGFEMPKSPRAIVVLDVWKVTTACGYGVPMVRRALYAGSEENKEEGGERKQLLDETSVFEDRSTLDTSAAKKEEGGEWIRYQRQNNAYSLDGLPGLRSARRGTALGLWLAQTRVRVAAQREGFVFGLVLGLVLALPALALAAAAGGGGGFSVLLAGGAGRG